MSLGAPGGRGASPADQDWIRSRSASTASKTIIFHDRAQSDSTAGKPSDPVPVLNQDGVSRPAGFFASSHLSVETLFYLATLGGAQVCNLEDRIGNFVVGKDFDALLVRTGQRAASSQAPAATNGSGPAVATRTTEDQEIERALAGGENVLSAEGVENPALMLEPDEGIERVFEKFLFTVSRTGLCRCQKPIRARADQRLSTQCRATTGTSRLSLCAAGRSGAARLHRLYKDRWCLLGVAIIPLAATSHRSETLRRASVLSQHATQIPFPPPTPSKDRSGPHRFKLSAVAGGPEACDVGPY